MLIVYVIPDALFKLKPEALNLMRIPLWSFATLANWVGAENFLSDELHGALLKRSDATLEKRGITWPDRVFAPTTDIWKFPVLDISDISASTGVKHYILTGITDDGKKSPSWGGAVGLEQNYYIEIINQLRKDGGDVIVSFGGSVAGMLMSHI